VPGVEGQADGAGPACASSWWFKLSIVQHQWSLIPSVYHQLTQFFLYFQAGEKINGLDPSDEKSKDILHLLGEVIPGRKPLAEEPKPDETQVSPEASDQGCGKSCQNKKAGPHDWYCLVLTQKGNYKISWVMGTLHINHCITFKCFEFKASLHITTDMIVARPSKNPATRKPTNVRRTLERKFLCDTLSSAIRPSISPPKNLVPNMPTVSCRQGKSPRPWLREPGPFSLR
jgi:hypothetical protein